MEAVGLAQGIPGLVQSCVHGYRAVLSMIAMDAEVKVLRLQYRVQECRILLWSRHWGLLESAGAGRKNFEDLLSIPGVQRLIQDILVQVQMILNNVTDETTASTKEPQSSTAGNADPRSHSVQRPTDATKPKALSSLASRMKWVVKNKSRMQDDLKTLRELNDGLQDLLPRSAKTDLSEALIGEVLLEEKITAFSAQLTNVFDAMQGSIGEHQARVQPKDTGAHLSVDSSEIRRPQSKLTLDEDGIAAAQQDLELAGLSKWRIASERFQDLDESQMQGFTIEMMSQTNASAKDEQALENSIRSVPCHVGEEALARVLVEWRSYEATIDHEQLQMALDARREQICHMFQDAARASSHYVLRCIGYVLANPTTMGLVFEVPVGSVGEPEPLDSILCKDDENDDTEAPDLNTRAALAEKLSSALYQLQCCGWLHRQISSRNVLFFHFRKPTELDGRYLDLCQPFLAGWQTARNDDTVHEVQSESVTTWRRYPFPSYQLPYVHPRRPMARFKRSYDVYALGVLLVEIALWEPITVLSDSVGLKKIASRNHIDKIEAWHAKILKYHDMHLSFEVGRGFKSAALWCLQCTQIWNKSIHLKDVELTDEDLRREVGLEKAFFWEVLRPLRKFSEALQETQED